MIKAVLFDFDETLQDRTAAFELYMNTFMDDFFPLASKIEQEKYKHDMVETGNGGYVDRVQWFKTLTDLWQWKGVDPEMLADHYDGKFGDHNVVFQDSVTLLKILKDKGYLTGVITNGPSLLQNRKMETSGLIPYLDAVVVSGDVGVHKPNKGLFKHTAEELGVLCCECVYVGDHPINDIEGALGAGMQAIRMNYGWFKDQNLRQDVPIITDIIDVLKYVD